ncbi:tRNA (guanosine(37)-N1)-methyltransferase TrmD [bacterium (Candidatus Torokbacteria) CG_4_10_14_0_2_um_filter_35_8]|nr:MAG: tRNA (guanosine(37)-N1)-methyltransferase TrmD [bacterium (Candidatus Torokbacteria) CG_4_10_14_0_2_um_filter_35_8]
MRFDILTIFPNIFNSYFAESIIKRAQKKDIIKIRIHDIRKHAKDKHKTTDDTCYGGGPGMVMKIEPIYNTLKSIKKKKKSLTILLSPQGQKFNQKKAKQLSKYEQLILICGRYEGVDERVRKYLINEEISIGDYVLTGGEIPAMVILDSVTRLIPGVVGKKESIEYESFENNLLDFPHYTKPENFKGWKVPKILLSGDHAKVEEWRRRKALTNTKKKRKDLLPKN